MHIQEFAPQSGNEPTHVVVAGNILGRTMHATGPLIGDHAQCCQWLTTQSDALVLGYERTGTGGHIDYGAREALRPENYAIAAAINGRAITRKFDSLGLSDSIPVILVGSSAAGIDVLEMARSETVRADYIGVYDTIAQRNVSVKDGFLTWAKYQKDVEAHKTTEQTNQNPLPKKPVWSQLNAFKSLPRTAYEMFLYADIWRTDRAMDTLSYIATAEAFQDTAVLAGFAGKTFTAEPGQTRAHVETLTDLRSPDAEAPFVARLYPDRLHSYTDDPARFASFVADVIALKS